MREEPAKDRYALMGHPIGHSRSPFIHAMFARQTSQRMNYELLDVRAEDLNSAVARFMAKGGCGLNFTVPHKQAAVALADELTDRAKSAGAVNTFLIDENGTVVGDNTDGAGLVRDLTINHGISLTGKRILMLGAGGAARGVIAPLLEQMPELIVVANRNVARAEAIEEQFRGAKLRASGFDNIEQGPFDLIINATSASLTGDLPPVPVIAVAPQTVCYDMAYGKQETEFNRWAHSAGAGKTLSGWGMLVEQAAEAFFLWRGMRPDSLAVLAALTAQG